MKPVIPLCLWELVTEKFGKDTWNVIKETAGFGVNTFLFAHDDIPDQQVFALVEATCKTLDISFEQAADVFGEYWVTSFAPRVYPGYLGKASSARSLLSMMPEIHQSATENIPNARPPRFDLSWEDENTLIMKYISERPLIDFAVGLTKGVGVYFGEPLHVTKLDSGAIKVVFL